MKQWTVTWKHPDDAKWQDVAAAPENSSRLMTYDEVCNRRNQLSVYALQHQLPIVYTIVKPQILDSPK